MYSYSKCIPQEALRDLDKAFKRFFNERKSGNKVGFPKFKKKFKAKDSFRLTGTIRVFRDQQLIQLPRLGKQRLKEYPQLPSSSRILNATVSREANSWFVAVTVEENTPDPSPVTGEIIGLDAGSHPVKWPPCSSTEVSPATAKEAAETFSSSFKKETRV